MPVSKFLREIEGMVVSTFSELKNPIVLALDVSEVGLAQRLFQQLADSVGCVKIGPRLLMTLEKELIKDWATQVPLFFDCKYFDIPSTTVESVRAAFEAGATWVTVHAANNEMTLEALNTLEKEIQVSKPFAKILGVTVLTSFSEKDLHDTGIRAGVGEQVSALSRRWLHFGLSGLVCSAHEVKSIKSLSRDAFLVTPGIRWVGSAGDQSRGNSARSTPRTSSSGGSDQRRTSTPLEALKNGSDALVIGRAIIEASEPTETLREILASLDN